MTPRERIMEDIRLIAKANKVAVREIMSPLRFKPIVKARHAAMWLLWWKYGFSLRRTALFFNRADHSTVAFGVGRHLIRCGIEHHWMTEYTKRKQVRARAAYTPIGHGGDLSRYHQKTPYLGVSPVENVGNSVSPYPCGANHISVSDMICSGKEKGDMGDERNTFEQIGVATERVVKRLKKQIEDGHGGHHCRENDEQHVPLRDCA